MGRRISALIFIFLMAGQAWSAVCPCRTTSKQVHACCKPKKEKSNYAATKGCCDGSGCFTDRGSNQVVTTLSANPDIIVVQAGSTTALPVSVAPAPIIKSTISLSRYDGFLHRYARPPDLYVRHHAFLI